MTEQKPYRVLADGVPAYCSEGEPVADLAGPESERRIFVSDENALQWIRARGYTPLRIHPTWSRVEFVAAPIAEGVLPSGGKDAGDAIVSRSPDGTVHLVRFHPLDTVDGSVFAGDVTEHVALVEPFLPGVSVAKPFTPKNFMYLPTRYKDRPKVGWTYWEGVGFALDPSETEVSLDSEAAVRERLHLDFRFSFREEHRFFAMEFLNRFAAEIAAGENDGPGMKLDEA